MGNLVDRQFASVLVLFENQNNNQPHEIEMETKIQHQMSQPLSQAMAPNNFVIKSERATIDFLVNKSEPTTETNNERDILTAYKRIHLLSKALLAAKEKVRNSLQTNS